MLNSQQNFCENNENIVFTQTIKVARQFPQA